MYSHLSWLGLIPGELWSGRNLLVEMILRELKTRVSGTAMGRLWLFGRPALYATAYFLIFAYVFEPKLPVAGEEHGKLTFAFFLLSGLMPWMAFAESIVMGASSVVGNGDLIRKTALPPVLFPVLNVAVTTFIYALPIWLLAFLALMFDFGSPQGFLLVPFWILLQAAVTVAIAVALSMLVAAFRDIEQGVGVAVGVGLFFAPIFYAVEAAPVMLKTVVWFNPFTPFANGYHSLIVTGDLPRFVDVNVAFAWLLGLSLCAAVLYARGRDQVVDWL